MNRSAERLSRSLYRKLWSVLAQWFRVPDKPPTLPSAAGETVESFRPGPGFLAYLKLKFWLALLVIDGVILVLWLLITVAWPIVGLALAIPALALAVLPDVVAYVAIHLRYDATWYVLTNRSLRIRRGIWLIHETTITFENVQNVSISQGPVQRWYGIANVLVETAGGGGGQSEHGGTSRASHQGLIEGIADAPRIRDMLLGRLRQSRSAGLGDETDPEGALHAWTSDHLTLLREIRDAASKLVANAR